MQPESAIAKLRELRNEASAQNIQTETSESLTWRHNVRSVLARALGENHHLVERFDQVRYSLSIWSGGTPDSAWEQAYRGGIADACSILDATIFDLEISAEDADVNLDNATYDPELMAHIRKTIESEDWEKLAAQVATFVEDKVRRWSESAPEAVGKGLYAGALADDSELRIGQTKGEWEGWRFLGMGLAQAIGNADRHRLQNRVDAKRYAIGVLGLGSLLLTQLRFEHTPLIIDRNV